jgi:uncharacterized protein YoxC
MNKERFRRKYLLGIFLSPLTLFPVVGGITAFLGLMLLNKIGTAVLSLMGGVAFGLGMLVQRLIIGSEKIARRAQQEVEAEDDKEKEAILDKLEEKLRQTEGTSDEHALRDLRALVKAFSSDSWRKNLNAMTTSDLLATIDQIFIQCINSLTQSLDLYNLSNEAASRKTRNTILERRESIIKGVQESVDRLNETLCAVQELGSSNNQAAKLSKLSQELNYQLAIAKRVKERVEDLGLNGYDVSEKTTL